MLFCAEPRHISAGKPVSCCLQKHCYPVHVMSILWRFIGCFGFVVIQVTICLK